MSPVYTPYPGPGRGISPAGIDKTSGFKADIVSASGINKQAGKSLSGLDTASNPVVTSFGLTGVTGTTATITWTTQIGQPLGSLQYRLAETNGAYTTVAEAGSPPLTSHSVPLTGLTAARYYEYIVVQPATGGATVGKTVWSGRFGTTGTVTPTEMVAPAAPSDGAVAEAPAPEPAPTPAPTAEETGEAPGLGITNVQVLNIQQDSATVVWRTDAYADGEVVYDTVPPSEEVAVQEGGARRLNHSVTIEGLDPGTAYRVEVNSQDAANHEAFSEPVEFQTLPAA